MPRLASIISEAWQARHAAANKSARFNEWLDDGTRWSVERSASDGPALRAVAIALRSRVPRPPRLWESRGCRFELANAVVTRARRSGAGSAAALLTQCGAGYTDPVKKIENLAGKANSPLRRGTDVLRDLLAGMKASCLLFPGV